MSETTPEAPYGYKADGTPYQRRPKGSVKAPERKNTGKKFDDGPARKDYTEDVQGLFQVAAFGVSFVSPADAWAISTYSPGISGALNELAQDRPEVAAVLDKLQHVGPYGALIGACIPLVAQVMANHKILPAGMLGTKPKEQIELELRSQAEQMKRQMEEEAKMYADLLKQAEESSERAGT